MSPQVDEAVTQKVFAYFLNVDENGISGKEVEGLKKDSLVRDFIAALESDPQDQSLKRVLGSEVHLGSYKLTNGMLELDFDSDYLRMKRAKEVLFRASIVQTLMQSNEVSFVTFCVNGDPLKNNSGKPVGSMTDKSFIYNAPDEIYSYEKTVLHLYFTDETGKKLVRCDEETVFSTNVPMEKLVMQSLIDGPKGKGAYPTIVSDTKLNSVDVKDGICYVSLDSGAADKLYDVSEEVVLYSIVDSLTEIRGIERVQISINGETDRVLRDKMSLAEFYERNLDLVK
ncbi:MAG: GerMN domain-containing protein [Lachnospiraceae bacterium]|nr:GerMN domain-containing protein [Lachnospiraceae bacterium]